MKAQIEAIDAAFRGLWKSYIHETVDSLEPVAKWSVTFICDGHYVETPYLDTPEEALTFAFKKIYHELN